MTRWLHPWNYFAASISLILIATMNAGWLKADQIPVAMLLCIGSAITMHKKPKY